MNKKYTWSFTGQIHAQGKRKKMIDQLKDCPGDSFFNINESWQSQDSLGNKDYKDILSNSVFVPCPRGNSSVDSFRLYECLECGAIPIIEKDKSWEVLLGDHPFLMTDSDWVAGKKYIQELYGKNDFLQKYQDKIQDWWVKFKISLKEDIKSKITYGDRGKYGDTESKKITIPNPGKKYLEHLKLSNPSVVKYRDFYYAVFRGEDFSEQIEDIRNKKIGIVQSLIYTKGSYWMKTLDSDFRVLSTDQLSFLYKGEKYKDYNRKDAKNGVAVFEDLRIIDQSVFIDGKEDVCCYATCSMLTDSFWRGFPPYQPGLCRINFSKKEIVFIKMLTDIKKEDCSHKNWTCINRHNGSFTIASLYPLAYEFSSSGEFGIKNKSIVSIAENIDYRNSCQPIELGENKYGTLCHKKKGTKYEYIWVEFFASEKSLEILSRKKIYLPNENAYCSGIIICPKRKTVMCFAGVNNFSYEIYDLEIKIEERLNEEQRLESKRRELINLKTLWPSLVGRDSLRYLSELSSGDQFESEDFSIYNSGKKIAIISLYTNEISGYAVYSEKSIKDYCYKNGYTFYVYRKSLDESSSPNWSKARAILNHINDHEDVIWMDSDTLIFNPDKKFEGILSKCSPNKKIIACEDIGTNNKNMPKGSMFNSGVLIFRNHEYTKNIIKKWMNFEGDKSSLYASGGDQEILCDILRKSDGFGHNIKIFKMNEFNTEPRMINSETFIIHFMAFPFELKRLFMMYFVSS